MLRAFHKQGLSASQIARAMGGGLSRNAVIGRAHRMGLGPIGGKASKPRRVVIKAPAAPPPVKRPMPKGVMVLAPLTGGEKSVAARAANIEARANPPESVVLMARSFTPLEGREPVPFGSPGCRWPVGGEGAEMLCCGAERIEATKTLPNPPYCAAHHRAATQTPKPGTPKNGNEMMRALRRYAA